MKIGLFLPEKKRDYNTVAASYWIRVFQMVSYYESLGATVYINEPFRLYDVAIFYRKVRPRYYRYCKYLKLISKKLYFDTCINIFDLHEEIDSTRLKYAFKYAGMCDGFICASDAIATKAKQYAKSVLVMEDPIDNKHLNNKKKNINFDNPTFGWTGVPHKSSYLNVYANSINNRIVLISRESIVDEKLEFNYSFKKWQYETFNDSLLACDIALLPRDVDTKYNFAHSPHKALVFAWLGIPIIANKIRSYVKLSEYYDGIVFLEDYDNSINDCINALKLRTLNTDGIHSYYSCENQSKRLMRYFSDK